MNEFIRYFMNLDMICLWLGQSYTPSFWRIHSSCYLVHEVGHGVYLHSALVRDIYLRYHPFQTLLAGCGYDNVIYIRWVITGCTHIICLVYSPRARDLVLMMY